MKRFLVLLSLIFIIPNLAVADDLKKKVLTLRDRSEIRNRLLKDRFESVLPDIMERTGIDMWIIVAREYNEDPVIKTMLPATWLNARRRTILVVYNPGSGNKLETYAIARYDVGEVFKRMWDPEQQPDQYKALAKLIYDKNPNKIGINQSEFFAQADGLTATEYNLLKSSLNRRQLKKVVSAEKLAIGWLETRSAMEMEYYPEICNIAHEIIKEGFSSNVITAGKTNNR